LPALPARHANDTARRQQFEPVCRCGSRSGRGRLVVVLLRGGGQD
jgi:hypothetical protein